MSVATVGENGYILLRAALLLSLSLNLTTAAISNVLCAIFPHHLKSGEISGSEKKLNFIKLLENNQKQMNMWRISRNKILK